MTVVVAIHSEDDIRLRISAAINEAHQIKEQEPARAARLIVVAHNLERRLHTVRPITYRPAPVDVEIHRDPSPAVEQLVDDYQSGTWPTQAVVV